jgi:MYXO-CTERM domain-containing protein
MRVLRTTAVVLSLASLAAFAQLSACGGDDDAAPANPNAGSDAASPSGATPTLTISSSRGKVYLGQTAKIDGPAIAPEIVSKLAWTVVAAPSTSAITTASIQDGATPTPSFKPDQLGLFTVQLNGEKADGVAASIVVIVEALDVPVFFRDVHVMTDVMATMGTVETSTLVAGAYGSPPRTLDCPRTTTIVGNDAGISRLGTVLEAEKGGAMNGDSWEGPPGTPARIAFPHIQGAFPGPITTRLTVATSTSTCAAADAKVIDTISGDPDAGVDDRSLNLIFNARFSPDGNRIAYLNSVNGVSRMSTIGFDGAGKQDISFAVAVGDGTLSSSPSALSVGSAKDGSGAVRPQWKDPTHVGWVSFILQTEAPEQHDKWELWVVEDKPGAAAELAMRCTGSGLTHFDFLPDGTVIAAVKHPHEDAQTGIMDLVVYRANASTKACEIARNLTNNTADGALARDLALSPDKATVAFFGGAFSNDLFVPLTRLSTVPVDGSRPAAPVPGVVGPADPGAGPRWGGGGTLITWGQAELTGGPSSQGVFSRLMSVPVGGGEPTVIVGSSTGALSGDDGGIVADYHFRFGMGQGCAAAPGPASSGIMIAFGLFGGAILVARRRSRDRA